MFTEQAVVHASQSLTSLTLNTNTTHLSNQNPTHQSHYQQPKKQQDKYNFHYQQHHHHSSSTAQQNVPRHPQPHNHNYHRQNKQVHTLPSSLPTSMESAIARRSSIIEHCSCGLTFKVDKNTNNIITSSTSLLTLNTIYNENPTLIDQTNNQGSLTQSQNVLQDTKHHYRRHQQSQQHEPVNKYSHHQHHAHHCHHHQTTSSAATASVTIPRYKPSVPPEIHTHEYFSQESQSQDHTTTITNTTASSASPAINAFVTPHSHGCRHSHVHAQTDFSYSQR